MGGSGSRSSAAMTGVRSYIGARCMALLVLACAAVLLVAPGAAMAVDNAACESCHAATMDMHVTDVNRTTACKVCHLDFAGSHPLHQAGANCAAACHPQWGDSLLTATPRYTDPLSGAAFASSASKSTPAEELHIIHSAARWPAGVTSSTSACASCHAAAACNACHTGAIPAAHAGHSSAGNATYPARTPWTGVVGYGVAGGDQTLRTSFETSNQCASAGCHDLATTQAARPHFVEDYNYAAGGNPDDPTGTSSAIAMTGTWRSRANTLYSGNRMSYNNVAGSSLSATFTGGRIEIVSDRDPYRGQADVLIDGAVAGSIDCYAPSTQIQAVVFAADVAQGTHTVAVQPTGLKNASARGTYVVVDAFNVYPSSRGSIAPKCSSCHAQAGVDHGARAAHGGGTLPEAWCSSCHTETNLMSIHDGLDETRRCVICHGTENSTVAAAVAAGDKRCVTCHAAPHAANHLRASATCAGPGCHNSPDLVNTHAGRACGTCHASVDAKVVTAVAAGDKLCASCHNPVLVHGPVHEASPDFAAPVPQPPHGDPNGGGYMIKCLSCHRSNLLANHGSDYTNCVICHQEGGARSSFTTWDKNCKTGACHPGPGAPHPATVGYLEHKHNTFGSGVQPTGLCQSCHGNPEGWQCGSPFGCHTAVVGPATSVDYLAPVTVASEFISDPLTWKLSATDQGDGVIATYYSFDGAPFTLYTAANAASGIVNPADGSAPYAHTLRYYSVDAAGHTEAIRTTSYDISDTTPPNVTFNGTGTVAKSLTMTVSDPKVKGLNTGVAYIYTEVKTYKTTWGWFPYQAFYQPMASFTYVKDASYDQTRTISAVELLVKAKSQPGFWPTYGGTIYDTGGGDAWFEIQYYARDFAGNQSPTTYAKLYVDNTAPSTSYSSAGTYLWRLTASDSIVGVDKTYYSFDGQPFVLYTATDHTNGIANPGGSTSGSHNLRYYSVDKLGNTETTKQLDYTIP